MNNRIINRKIIYNILRKIYYTIGLIIAVICTKLFANSYKKYVEIKCDIDPLSRKRICIFSHFDVNNKIADYVIYYLKQLNELGCAIFFVSTCKTLEQSDIEKAKPFISSLITRSNHSMDFGSFYIGLEAIKNYTHYDFLIFANDSVYGPFYSLHSIIELINKENSDVVGMTDSWEFSYHLQSYFLIFSKKVFTSEVFINFFKNFLFSKNKTFIVHRYEVGLSKLLIKNGFKLNALCNYLQVAFSYCSNTKHNKLVMKRPFIEFCNPTHYFWSSLIQDFNYPFIKRELIFKNPEFITNLYMWPEIVKQTGYNIRLVEEHLKQVG